MIILPSLTVRQVPLMATLAPTCTPSAAPAGKLIDSDANSPCFRTERTVAFPCTMPVARQRNTPACSRAWIRMQLASQGVQLD